MTDFLSLTIDAETDQDFVAQFTHIQSQLDISQSRRLGFILRYLLNGRLLAEVRSSLAGTSVREILETYGDEAVVWCETKRNSWAAISTAFRQGTADDVLSLTCPKCAGPLHAKFDGKSPQPDGSIAGYMNIVCTSCNAGTCVDSLQETPPWVNQRGATIVTIQKS